MNLFFDDRLFERFTVAALTTVSADGAEIGEILATTRRIKEGDRDGWHREWTATAERLFAAAEAGAAHGHAVSAREAYLRACVYFRTSYLPLFGAPVDARLVAAFERECEAFRRAAALFTPPIEPVEIPFEGTTLPGYFSRADDSGRPRPTLLATNGYDATVHLMHFGHGAAAVRRGYHCLLFDGPGQGRVLIRQGLPMRPDWENVVRPVVDFLLTRTEVDPSRIALLGWSFGGYLAPRAASGEPRLAACIADPGQWDMLEALRGFFPLAKEVLDRLPDVEPEVLQPVFDAIRADPELRWTFVQRGLWVHGLGSLMDYVRAAKEYSLNGQVEQIRCPTLVTWAESDPVARLAERLFDALRCPKALVRFTADEGAGDHCEGLARSLFHQRTFDWLDEVLTAPAATPAPRR